MPLQLWIPESAREAPQKVYRCGLCDKRFPAHQQREWQRHVGACFKRNEDIVAAAEKARKASAFTAVQDEEQLRWLRERAREGGSLNRAERRRRARSKQAREGVSN